MYKRCFSNFDLLLSRPKPWDSSVTVPITSGFKFKNTDGQTLRRRHRVGVGDSESTPAETALPVDSLAESAKRVC